MKYNTVTDQMGLSVEIPDFPQRIISLVPSQTELLFDLGLGPRIAGVTRFCIHPADQVGGKERVGGTKKFDFDKIHALRPDLIIGNKEENYQEGIAELKKHYPVWMSDIYDLDGALRMMDRVGEMTDAMPEARSLISAVTSGFAGLPPFMSQRKISCAYLIWRRPYMVAASGTFITAMMEIFGVANAFVDMVRYPAVTASEIAERKPDLIFLSSEPYSFSDKHVDEFKAISPASDIRIVDGELFSWYGSRLRYAPGYFRNLRRSIFVTET